MQWKHCLVVVCVVLLGSGCGEPPDGDLAADAPSSQLSSDQDAGGGSAPGDLGEELGQGVVEDLAKIFAGQLEQQGIDVRTLGGNTPLHNAAWSKNVDEAKRLLAGGADIHALNDEEFTPLHMAAAIEDNGAFISLLLEHGADPKRATSGGVTPLLVACGHNIFGTVQSGESIAELLKAGADVQVRGGTGRGPLSMASEMAPLEIVSLLIEAGDDVNQADEDGWTPLHYAAATDAPEIIELLLKAGAKRDARTKAGESLLFLAVTYVRSYQIQMYEEYRDLEPEWTDLHWAAIHGSVEEAKQALAAGVDVNAQDAYGRTALSWVIGESEWWYAGGPARLKLLQYLLEAKAAPNVADKQGLTPFLHAVSLHGVGVVTDALTMLKEGGANHQVRDKQGNTALLYAVRSSTEASVDWLVKEGHDIHVVDDKGANLLHYAVEEKDDDMVAHLVRAGVDYFACDNDGKLPIDRAEDEYYRARIESEVKDIEREQVAKTVAKVAEDRKSDNLAECDPAKATSPKEAVRQLIRATHHGDAEKYKACFVGEPLVMKAVMASLEDAEAGLAYRQAVIDRFGDEGYHTLQNNRKGTSFTIDMLDESIVDRVVVNQASDQAATVFIPAVTAPGPLKLRKLDGLWKIEATSIYADGPSLIDFVKQHAVAVESRTRARAELAADKEEKLTLEEFDELSQKIYLKVVGAR